MKRLDVTLVERGLCESREKAQRAIMAGFVRINQQPARKPSDCVRDSDELLPVGGEKYVSRGGFKLEHALQHFRIEVRGAAILIMAASKRAG